MRLSEFRQAVVDEFGAYGKALCAELVLTELSSRTANEALKAGVPARDVWLALCRMQDVPEDRRYGVGRLLKPQA
ncbi:MAG: DUF3046 domain-containing protein [Microbacteriaceae bacterium]